MVPWVIVPTIVEISHDYLRWKLHCETGGSALNSTDVFSETYMPRNMRPKLQGLTYMRLDIVPGTGSAIPTALIDLTLSNSVDHEVLSVVDAPLDAHSTHDMAIDINMYPKFYSHMYLTMNECGVFNDVIDLYFECWREKANA